jgi:hypothetical protein
MHEILRQYRVLQMSLIVFLSTITWLLIDWITQTPFNELQDWHLAPVTAALPALIAGLFGLANSVMKGNQKDELHKD